MNKKLFITLITIFTFFYNTGYSQTLVTDSLDTDIIEYKQQSRQLIAFLEHSLNTLGSKRASAKEKDIIVNKSYLKFFRDNEVQIEDDLDNNREYVINKDIQAYLKDIDFFFKIVEFELNIINVEFYETNESRRYIKVEVDRNMRGKTIDNKDINSNKTRFIEININEEQKLLKIASIYSIKISEEKELRFWWDNLSEIWKILLSENIDIKDTISFVQLKNIRDLEEITIKNNSNVKNIDPLSRLIKLKKLICVNTEINSLTPIRNLTNIEILNCSKSNISTLEPIKKLVNIKELYCNNTNISNLDAIKELKNMEVLDCSNTEILNIDEIANLSNLKELFCNDTKIKSLKPLTNLTEFKKIYCFNNQISNLQPLANKTNLEELHFYKTQVNDLEPIMNLKNLKLLYFDNTIISKKNDKIESFIASHPNCKLIYKSEELKKWWVSIPKEWQNLFRKKLKTDIPPTNEQLHEIDNITEISINGNDKIKTLEPIKNLKKLKIFTCINTSINNLEPLSLLTELETLDCTNTGIISLLPLSNNINLKNVICIFTKINDISPLAKLINLQEISISNTQIKTITPLINLKNLKTLSFDDTPASKNISEIYAFMDKRPKCLTVYKTQELQAWWETMPEGWKKVFKKHVNFNSKPTTNQLHKLASLNKLEIPTNSNILNLNQITQLTRLKEFRFADTGIKSIEPLENLIYLEIIDCQKNPIQNLSSLTKLSKLKKLNLENTQVEDLTPLSELTSLEELNCSGTQISMIGLRPLSTLSNLKYLECYNTNVVQIKPILGLKKLETLKCYNTRILKLSIDKFKRTHKNCDVDYY